MADDLGPVIQTLTDGRLTLKPPQRGFLGNPPQVDATMGPANAILLHNCDRRLQLLEQIVRIPEGKGPNKDQLNVRLRLDGLKHTCQVDDQGRLRLPEMLLELAGLTDKSCKVFLVPDRVNGWLEIWPQEDFKAFFKNPQDQWLDSLNSLIEA